jgi:hypothetical protein
VLPTLSRSRHLFRTLMDHKHTHKRTRPLLLQLFFVLFCAHTSAKCKLHVSVSFQRITHRRRRLHVSSRTQCTEGGGFAQIPKYTEMTDCYILQLANMRYLHCDTSSYKYTVRVEFEPIFIAMFYNSMDELLSIPASRVRGAGHEC